MKRLWLVRLGRHGEQEAHALDKGELVLGFRVGNLEPAKDRNAILKIIEQAMPGQKPKKQLNFAAQLNQFSNTIQKGDLVVVPLKTAPKIAFGEITGPCTPTADGHPMRPVRWLKSDVPRDVFRQDLLYSFGAFMTVCEISRNDALQRVEAILRTGRDPGYESGVAAPPRPPASPEAPTAEEADVDLDEIARDQIERRVASAFAGHEFTRLVAEILKAQGYIVNVSPPGPDNGIDIVAGRGAASSTRRSISMPTRAAPRRTPHSPATSASTTTTVRTRRLAIALRASCSRPAPASPACGYVDDPLTRTGCAFPALP